MAVAMLVAMVAVPGIHAAQRHALKERVQAQSNHQPNRQPAMLVRVRVAMLDASREVLEHYLGKKTDQDERSKIRPPIIADEHFRQHVQRGNREQVGAAEGDQQLELVGIRGLDP